MDKDRAQELHQNIQDKERMNPPIPLVTRTIILFGWSMEHS
jgi:hypothetical protein